MSVRSLSLEEWFTYYQLKHIGNKHFHLPAFIEVDLSTVYKAYQGQSFPLTFILIKALALTLKHEPDVNRQVVYNFLGRPLMREAEGYSINVPVMLNHEGQDYVSLTIVKEAHTKSIAEIKSDIKTFCQSKPQDLPVGRYIFGKKNTFYNRLRLKCIHWVVNHAPSLHDRFETGAASMSSLLNLAHQGTNVCFVGRGSGAFSITASHFDEKNCQLKLGLAWDHYTGTGVAGVGAAMTLCRILQAEIEPEALLS